MEHKYIIIFLTIILILLIIYYEFCFKNIVFEKFETINSRWDDKISLQVLRDMLGIFFNEQDKSFNIPGGLSVREIVPAIGNLSTSPTQRLMITCKFKKGTNDGRLQLEAAVLS